MADRENDRAQSDRSQDGGARSDQLNDEVQEELRREAQEGRDDIGQVGENRNVSGSSTWDTLKDKD